MTEDLNALGVEDCRKMVQDRRKWQYIVVIPKTLKRVVWLEKKKTFINVQYNYSCHLVK